jgi:signal peptidase II
MNIGLGTRVVLILIIVATVGCDRVTKHIASSRLAGAPDRSYLADSVRFAYVENTGGFLSLGADLPHTVRTAVFTVATGLMLLGLAVAGIRYRWSAWPLCGLALFIAGGASNWIDRVVHGSVVDFMNVGIGPLRTGIFNVADVAILLGAGIFMAAEFRREPDSAQLSASPDEEPPP